MAKKTSYESSLKALRPDLMKEWDDTTNSALGLFPEKVSPHSHQKVSWICSACGNGWIAEINSRARGTGCPKCKGNKISESKRKVKSGNSLLERFPHVAEEWHPTKNGVVLPKDVNAGSSDTYWWKCKYGHEWEAKVCNRTTGHTNCPKCSDEMHTSFPEQAVYYYVSRHFFCQNRAIIQNREIDIYIPEIKFGIEYDGRYYHKKDDSHKEEKKDAFFDSIGITVFRIKEDSSDYVEPRCIHYTYSSSNYLHLDWAIGELLKKINVEENVDVSSNQVRILAQYIQSIKDNSLQAKCPELAKEWDIDSNNGITSDMVSAGSKMNVYWKCKNNHIYLATISERARYYKQGKSFGCPYCSGHKVLSGFNDLQTINPTLAKEWDISKNGNITPADVTVGSSSHKYWWNCSVCGNSYQATVKNRTSGRGCPACKNLKISTSLTNRAAQNNTFADALPELICEWDSENTLKPTDISPHSNKKIKWICSKCGHKWETSANNRASGYGCKECNMKNRKIWNKKSVICVETNEVYDSIVQASESMQISKTCISNCLNGRSKTAGGFHWKYTEK